MPGMATVTEIDALRSAKFGALDRMFLELMLRHHQGGQAMLTAAQQEATVAAVRNLAARIAFHQQEETRVIGSLLAQAKGAVCTAGKGD